MPESSTIIAVVMEFVVGIALLVEFLTRSLALLLAVYTLGTDLLAPGTVAHSAWRMAHGT